MILYLVYASQVNNINFADLYKSKVIKLLGKKVKARAMIPLLYSYYNHSGTFDKSSSALRKLSLGDTSTTFSKKTSYKKGVNKHGV